MNLNNTLSINRKIQLWGALILASVIININLFKNLLNLSLKHEFSSHILLIPFISLFLIFRERTSIFQSGSNFSPIGMGIALLGVFAAEPWIFSDLSLRTLGIVVLWVGTFLLIFGYPSFKKALFPLLFLIFMIPIPDLMLQHIVKALQDGSAETSSILFTLTGTPFFREGTYFQLPRIPIDIAPGCSSIRSSLALLITCLLASHLLLESNWRKLLFVAVAVPMSLVKNGVRIVVLSLLAIHVDKRWLTDSKLHHDGGILFFILALLLMFPLLLILRKSEQKPKDTTDDHAEKQNNL